MIEAASREELELRTANYAYFGVYMQTAYDIYADKAHGARFFIQGASAALMLTGNAALLCGEVDDDEELRAFLHMMHIKEIKSSSHIPRGYSACGLALMHKIGGLSELPILPQGFSLAQDSRVYDIIQSGCFVRELADSDDFYSDTCLRISHGYAELIALTHKGRVISTAGVYAQNRTQAYIAGVATRLSFERHGCASYLLSELAYKYAHKTLCLVCSADMCGFYERLQFARTGTVIRCLAQNNCR